MTSKSMPQHLRIWIFVAVLAVIVVIVGAVISTLFKTTPSHFELAQEAYISGDFSTALTEFDRAVNEDPTNPDYLIGRGLTHLSFENYGIALDDFTNAIALDPESDDTRPYLHGGYIMIATSNYDVAIEALTTAINRGNNSALVYSYRGLAYYNLEEYAAAVIDLKIATDIDDSTPEVFRTLGDANYALGNNEAALSAYTHYLEIQSQPLDYVIENINAINAQS